MAPFGNMFIKIFSLKFQLQKNKQHNQTHEAKLTTKNMEGGRQGEGRK